jgi:hypothetical protein
VRNVLAGVILLAGAVVPALTFTSDAVWNSPWAATAVVGGCLIGGALLAGWISGGES